MLREMMIKELLQFTHGRVIFVPEELRRKRFSELCQDSRRASPAGIFFCRVGALTDGHFYARQAYDNGARCFVVERELELPTDAAQILVKDASVALTKASIAFYEDPGRELELIGITGTKGKTTIALSVFYIASAYGIKIGYIGTNGVYYGDKRLETVNTTPDALELQKSLREMRDSGVTHVVIEVSSQAMKQDRCAGLQFKTCAFTNLYEDHIGGAEHADMQEYMDCKRKLFTEHHPESIVINADDEASAYMIKGARYRRLIRTSAKGASDCELCASNIRKSKNGIRPGVSFTCHGDLADGEKEIFIPLPGLYSAQNGLLTLAICRLLKIPFSFIAASLSNLQIPGRFETVMLESKPGALFVIDYAHNGASLTAVLKALREYEPKRIICLFGSVGGRTFGRREELGLAARAHADVVIITSDNPANEDPCRIIADIQKAFAGSEMPVHAVVDRKEAVQLAYELAEDGDYILLAGKGHETYQLIIGERVPFSERKILEHADRFALVMG